MHETMRAHLKRELDEIRQSGLYKDERVLLSPQRNRITAQGGWEVLNLCSNNYLGLSSHPQVVAAARPCPR